MTIKALFVACLFPVALAAQSHTVVVFHPDPHTVSELDPSTGKVIRTLKVENEPHEAVLSPDGKTFYASLPAAAKVVIIDAATLTQKGTIESDLFKAPPHPQGRGGNVTT